MKALIIALAAVAAPRGQDVPDTIQRALAVVEEARAVARNAGGRVWPGWSLDTIPIALFTEAEAYLVHHPKPPAGFQPVELESFSLEVARGTRTPEMNANTSGLLAGAVTAFVSIDSLGSGAITARNVALVLHEAGHAFRERAPQGGKARWPAENAMLVSEYPTDSAFNNAWGRIEGALLADALEAEDEGALRELILDFLAVRARRQAELEPALVEFEKHLELNEGLAEYFARRAVLLAEPPYAPTEVAAARGLSADGYGRRGLFIEQLRSDLRRINLGGEGAARQRFYATGAALGLILDRLDPAWKQDVEERDADLQSVLSTGLAAQELEERLQRISDERGLELLLGYERAAAEAAEARRRSKLHAVLAAPGPKLVLDLSRAGGAGQVSAFDPMNIVPVEAGLRVHTRMLSLSYTGGSASFEQPVVQDLERGLVITALPADVELELDLAGAATLVRGAGVVVRCAQAQWLEEDGLFLLAPGAEQDELDTAPILARLEAARVAATEPLPAAPFEAADLLGHVHRQPEQPPRSTALLFFSAADWARPSHGFVRELLSELEADELSTTSSRLLLVASQCSRNELDSFLADAVGGGNAAGRHVLHDPDRALAHRYDVGPYPTVVWVDPRGFIEEVTGGYTAAKVRALVERLRRSGADR